MNGFHFIAQNCHIPLLRFLIKQITKLPREVQKSQQDSDQMNSQDSDPTFNVEKMTQALKVTGVDKNNILHFALTNPDSDKK